MIVPLQPPYYGCIPGVVSVPSLQYRVEIGSVMDLRWMEYFPVVAYTITKGNEHGRTDMIIAVVDQSELIGIVNQLHGYGVDLLSVALVQDSPAPTSH